MSASVLKQNVYIKSSMSQQSKVSRIDGKSLIIPRAMKNNLNEMDMLLHSAQEHRTEDKYEAATLGIMLVPR